MTAEELEKALSFDSAAAIRGLLKRELLRKNSGDTRSWG